jgi:cell division protein FtsA
MTQKISVGIDIGTTTIKVVVAESVKESHKNKPKIIGIGYSESEGLRHGYIVSPEDAARSIRKAVSDAQKTSGYKIDKAYFSIGSAGLQGITHTTSLGLGSKEIQITSNDLEQALEECQNDIPADQLKNKDIIHTIPLGYKIDGNEVYGRPQGMVGSVIEIKTFFVTAISQHLNSLLETARLANIEIEDITASPIASSIALLSKSQQVAGCALLSVGAETTTLGVFENGVPICIEVLPLGSRDITNDIALGFKVSLEEAERIKISRPDSLPYPKRKIEEVVKARLEDICDFTQNTLKKIGKNGLLPAGILVTGGGALSYYIEDLIRNTLKLPTKKIGIKFIDETSVPVHEATWSTAYGLTIIGIGTGSDETSGFVLGTTFIKTTSAKFRRFLRYVTRLTKRILP